MDAAELQSLIATEMNAVVSAVPRRTASSLRSSGEKLLEFFAMLATKMQNCHKVIPWLSVRRSSADGRALESDETIDNLLQEGAAAIAEIDKLMRQLKIARDYLQAEGERLHREMARYAQLTRTALAFAKTISEQVNDWRDY